MNDTIRTEIEAATVHLPGKQGQGVLVAGGLILTAAHCVESYNEGGMVLGDHCFETIKTKSGLTFKAGTLAVEPVADIAVLGSMDNQVFPEDSEALEDFVEQTSPARLLLGDPVQHEWFPACVLSHRGSWIPGKYGRFGLYSAYPAARACISIETDAPIEGGTSGGPVVDDNGELLGVVSWGNTFGSIPFAKYALPRWAVDHIAETQRESG